MAYKLQITDKNLGINCNVRYQNLAQKKKPQIIAKAPNGREVHERTTLQNKVLPPGSTQRQWVDDDGNIYSKQTLTFWYGDQQVSEVSQTKVLEIEGYQALENYTDKYVIEKFYELFPDTNGMKKDFDKEIARKANLSQMRKLWEYLNKNKVVARGEFCPSSRGFLASDGYIRAISIDGKWGLEIGVFKEEKIFQHLQEDTTFDTATQQPAKVQKLKMV